MIPARFISMTLHFICTCMVFYTLEQNIIAELGFSYSSSDYSNAEEQMNYALAVSMICFLIQYFGLLSGVSMFFHKVNALQITLNTLGLLTLFFYVIENWKYSHYWTLIGIFSAVPAFLETMLILLVPMVKGLQY